VLQHAPSSNMYSMPVVNQQSLQGGMAPATQPIMTTQLPNIANDASMPSQAAVNTLSGPTQHRRQLSQPPAGGQPATVMTALGTAFQSPPPPHSHLQMTLAQPSAPPPAMDAQISKLLDEVAALAIAAGKDIKNGHQLRPGCVEGLQQMIAQISHMGQAGHSMLPGIAPSESSMRSRPGSVLTRHSHNESNSTVLSSEGSPLLKKRPHLDDDAMGPAKSLRSENGTPVHPAPPPPASAPPTVLKSPVHGSLPMMLMTANLAQPPSLVHHMSESQVPQLQDFRAGNVPMSGQPLQPGAGRLAAHTSHRLASTNHLNASTASLGSTVLDMHQNPISVGLAAQSLPQSPVELHTGQHTRDRSLDLAAAAARGSALQGGVAPSSIAQQMGVNVDGGSSRSQSQAPSVAGSGVHSPVGHGLRAMPSHNSLHMGFMQQAQAEMSGLMQNDTTPQPAHSTAAAAGGQMLMSNGLGEGSNSGLVNGVVGGIMPRQVSNSSDGMVPHSTPLQSSFTLNSENDGYWDESMDDTTAEDSAASSMIFLPGGGSAVVNAEDKQATLRPNKHGQQQTDSSAQNSLAQIDFSMGDETGEVSERKGPGNGAAAAAAVPLEPELQAKLDPVFFDFLSRICSDLEAKDNRGELIHQTLMPKKMARLDESRDFRPFKFRIQAFTNAFYSDLQERGVLDETLNFKKMKQFLWANPHISRYNDDGRKAKSKGNHVWMISARKIHNEDGSNHGWQFHQFTRKIARPQEDFAYPNVQWTWDMRIWDPQTSSDSIKAAFTVNAHPKWLQFDGMAKLSGTPQEGDEGGPITVTAHYPMNGQLHQLGASFDITVRKVASPSDPSRVTATESSDNASNSPANVVSHGPTNEHSGNGEGDHPSVLNAALTSTAAAGAEADNGAMTDHQDDSAMFLPFEPQTHKIVPPEFVPQTMAALQNPFTPPIPQTYQPNFPFGHDQMLGSAVASGPSSDMAGRDVLMNTHGIHPGQMDAAMQMLQQQQQQSPFVLANPPPHQGMSSADQAQFGGAILTSGNSGGGNGGNGAVPGNGGSAQPLPHLQLAPSLMHHRTQNLDQGTDGQVQLQRQDHLQQQLQQQVAADSMAPLFGAQPMTQVNASGLNQTLLGMPPAEN